MLHGLKAALQHEPYSGSENNLKIQAAPALILGRVVSKNIIILFNVMYFSSIMTDSEILDYWRYLTALRESQLPLGIVSCRALSIVLETGPQLAAPLAIKELTCRRYDLGMRISPDL